MVQDALSLGMNGWQAWDGMELGWIERSFTLTD